MKWSYIKHLIKSDLPRYGTSFLRAYLTIPGFKYTTNQRLCAYLALNPLLKPLWFIQWLRLRHFSYKFGIQTFWATPLPSDFVISHFGGIVFFPKICGSHIYLRQGVTVGGSTHNGKTGSPILGSNIEFGANSTVIGPITIGDNVTIGAGAVVVDNVPDNSIVAGVPAKVIKLKSIKS